MCYNKTNDGTLIFPEVEVVQKLFGKKGQLLILCIMISSVLVTACGSKTDNIDVSAASKITVTNEEVGFSLLKNAEPDEDGNIFISPTSVLIAMLMVYNGTDGETKKEIEDALEINGLTEEEINEATKALLTALERNDEKLEVTLANSLWLNDDFSFQDEFAKNMKDYFAAEISEIDIKDDASAKQINDWVKKETENMIEEIVDSPLPNDIVAYIINALYFKGNWQYEFDENATNDDIFHTENGEEKMPFMSLDKDFTYLDTDYFQAIKLPYNEGEMNMQVFLPKEGTSVDELAKELDTKAWKKWQDDFSPEVEGTVLLPKFTLEYETLLNEPLKQLGIIQAFGDGELPANLSRMVNESVPLQISEVKQKTAIEVDETGTEASAVTSVGIEMTSAPIEDERFYMDINRPFLLAIYDEELEHALFLGIIKHPKQNNE